MGRKIVFEVAQPVYDADGDLVANVGERISEAAYDKLKDSVAPGSYKAVIVETEDPAPKAKPEPKAAASKGLGGG